MDLIQRSGRVTKALVLSQAAVNVLVYTNVVSAPVLQFSRSHIASGEVWRLITGLAFFEDRHLACFQSLFDLAVMSNELDGSYYRTSREYMWRIILLLFASALASFATGYEFPVEVFSIALKHLVMCRKGNLVIVWVFQVVSQLNALLLFCVRLASKDWMYCKMWLIGMAIGHCLILAEDVLPQWSPNRRHLIRL